MRTADEITKISTEMASKMETYANERVITDIHVFIPDSSFKDKKPKWTVTLGTSDSTFQVKRESASLITAFAEATEIFDRAKISFR